MATTTSEQVIIKLTASNTQLRAKLKESENAGTKAASMIKRAFIGVLTIGTIKKVVEYGDAWSNVTSRLKLVSSNTKEFINVQNQLFNVSQDARVGLEGTIDLYSKLARGTKELGVSTEDLLGVTSTISKAMTISGASTTEANSALLQFSQGMSSGVLRGEELNSVMENTPRLAIAIAEGMDVSIGRLRALGAEGKLTTGTVLESLKNQANTINEEFKQIPQTVSQSFVKLQNVALVSVGKISQAFGANSGLAKMVDAVADAFTFTSEEINRFAAFSTSVAERTGLIFKALGLSIVTSFVNAYKASGIAFNAFSIELHEGILSIIDSFNLLPKVNIDTSAISLSLNRTIESSRALKSEIISMSNETRDAIIKAASFDIMEESINKYKELTEAIKIMNHESNITAYNKQLEDLKARLDPIGNAYKLLISDIKILNSLKKEGILGEKDYQTMLQQTSSNYSKMFHVIKDGTKDANKALGSSVQILASGMTSAFRQAMDGATSFGDIFENVAKDIVAQLIHIMVVQQAVNALMGAFSGGSSASGAVQGPVRVDGMLADGGTTKKSGSFLVGERGPEIVTLPNNSNVTPNGGTVGGGGGTTVNVYNNTSSQVEVKEDEAGKIDIIISAIANQITRGTGVIGASFENRYGLSKV